MKENILNDESKNHSVVSIPATNRINPWLAVWYRPRQAFTWFIHNRPERMIIPLVLLGGFQSYLLIASDKSLGDFFSLSEILFLAILSGFLIRGCSFYIW